MVKFTFKLIMRPLLKAVSLLLFFVTLLTAYGGYLNPSFWTLPSMGVIVFPYFAMATLIVAILWLAFRRLVMGCIGIGVLIACGPTLLAAMPLHFHSSPSNSARTFRMITFNSLHMKDLRHPEEGSRRPLEFLIESGADFICLQELYSIDVLPHDAVTDSLVAVLKDIYPYRSNSNSEVELLSKYPFEPIVPVPDAHVKYGSMGAYRMMIDGEELTVVNVHLSSYMLSNNERNVITEVTSEQGAKKSLKELEGSVYNKMKSAFEQRAELSKAVAEWASEIPGNVIVCGDFNDVPGSWTYRNFTRRGFEDAYAQTGFGHLITYNDHMMYFHIDQILYRGDLVPLKVTKGDLNASDHYPLIAEFEFI